MAAFPARYACRRCLVWLLSAALLLPIAQTAATWHLLSLACMDRGDLHSKPLSHPSHCDFCLTAAGFSGGVGTGGAASPPPPVRLHEAPLVVSTRIASALSAWAYRSRAPPSAQS